MNTKINNLYFLLILSCFLHAIGYMYWDQMISSTIFFVVSLVAGNIILFSKELNEDETREFFRKNAFIFLCLNLITFYINQEQLALKALCLAINNATFVACFFWLITWLSRIGNNRNNNTTNRQLRRRWNYE